LATMAEAAMTATTMARRSQISMAALFDGVPELPQRTARSSWLRKGAKPSAVRGYARAGRRVAREPHPLKGGV
jgi:hypothetical protein